MSEGRTLASLLDLAWGRIEAGLEGEAPARQFVLATVADGRPAARTMVLRGADRGAGTIETHTDVASPKVAELRADPQAVIHVWDEDASIQIRLRSRVEVVTGPEAHAIWEGVPEGARDNYGGEPAPGEPIERPEDYEPGASRERFAVLRARVDEIDLLSLDDPALRALYERSDGFAGRWLAQ